ncbi:MAG: undecaprenyl diphosphate synthase family protein, partial [Spirochaetales bacterium]
ELFFSDCLWPDYSESDLIVALESYASRERRFGGTK